MYHTNLDFLNICMSKTLVPYRNVACVPDVNKSQYVCERSHIEFTRNLKPFLTVSKIKNKSFKILVLHNQMRNPNYTSHGNDYIHILPGLQ
jgi:hypothetical protein